MYKFDKDDLEKVKIDVSFHEGSGTRNTTKLTVDYVINYMNMYPEIKPIIHVLKRFLQMNNLNSSFNGKYFY